MPRLSSSFEQTLQAKLQELDRQRIAHASLSKGLSADNALPRTRASIISEVESLVSIIKNWKGPGKIDSSQVIGGKLNLQNLQFWLPQAREDPTFNLELLKSWTETLKAHIKHTNERFDAGKLLGDLCKEWLESDDSATLDDAATRNRGMSEESEAYVKVEKEEEMAHKDTLRSTLFENHDLDISALQQHLEALFSSDDVRSVLGNVRSTFYNSQPGIEQQEIHFTHVKSSIKGLLASDLMSNDQRNTLQEISENLILIQEVASLLNMRLSNISSWAWPDEGLLVDLRENSDGEVRPFTDPEIIDAILLQHLGVLWQTRLQTVLRDNSWCRHPFVDDPIRKHCLHQLEDMNALDRDQDNICFQRGRLRESVALSGLQVNGRNPPSFDGPDEPVVSVEQRVLGGVATDCMLNMAVYGSHAMVRSRLEPFGLTVAHDAILIILAFLGLPQQWLDFFHSYLAMPMRLDEEDQPTIQTRGTPAGFALSTFLEEAMLFIMDFAVNQRAGGLFPHRINGEILLWDWNAEKVGRAWAEMKSFTELVGLQFNASETGSAYLGPQATQISTLPPGEVGWGLLKFDTLLGRFVVDQDLVTTHINTFRQRLTANTSVLGWVKIYNEYMTYLYRKMGGTPAKCLGHVHVEAMIATFQRVQEELFPNEEQAAIGHLRKIFAKKFNTHDLPDGYFYFPMSWGGLGLKNILLDLFALQKNGKPLYDFDNKARYASHPGADVPLGGYLEVDRAPVEKKFRNQVANDVQDYHKLKQRWDAERLRCLGQAKAGSPSTDDLEEFMSLDAYLALREFGLGKWGKLYFDMLGRQREMDVLLSGSTSINPAFFLSQKKRRCFMGWEMQWLVSMYGEGVVDKFGCFDIVDENLIPVGIVQLFKNSMTKVT